MRFLLIFITLYGLVFRCHAEAETRVFRRLKQAADGERLTCIGTLPGAGGCIYIGTEKRVWKSGDAGMTWSCIFKCAQDAGPVYDIYCRSSLHVYIATGKGLYATRDGGMIWVRLFKSRYSEDRPPLSVAVSGVNAVYVLSQDGLHRSDDDGLTWLKIFANDTEESHDTDMQEGEWDFSGSFFRRVRIDFAGNVYLVTENGIYKSSDMGVSWRIVTGSWLRGYGLNGCLVPEKEGDDVYVAADKGVLIGGDSGSWTIAYSGLESPAVRGLAHAGIMGYDLWCVTGSALYGMGAPKNMQTAGPVSCPDNVPGIRQVQEAAIAYAEVGPEKIQKWRKAAKFKAILPRVSFGVDHSGSDTYEIYTSSAQAYSIVGPRDNTDSWDITLTWELGDLIYNESQTSIDVRSKLMVQLREDILASLTRIYYERRSIARELAVISDKSYNETAELHLRLEELTSYIDGYTGGWFSEAAACDSKK
ncbi:MAG: hypothetical protein ABH885_02315 [Candidatus Omnitrophota bacterium]